MQDGFQGYMAKPAVSAADYAGLVGTELGVSDWVEIPQGLVGAFADATGDHQFIHVDPARAAMTPLGGTVAHGFLTLALLGGLGPKVIPPVAGSVMGFNYGFNRLRFVTPVRTGSRVRARFVLKGFEEKAPKQYTSTYDVTVEIEGLGKPALVAEWLTVAVVG